MVILHRENFQDINLIFIEQVVDNSGFHQSLSLSRPHHSPLHEMIHSVLMAGGPQCVGGGAARGLDFASVSEQVTERLRSVSSC